MSVHIPESFINEIISEEAAESARISEKSGVAIVDAMMGSQDGVYQLLAPFLKGKSNPKILELGSGNGLQLCNLLLRGLDAYGIEPGEAPFDGRFARALGLLEANGIRDARSRLLPAFAERLPFDDDSFDIVISTAVIEHVNDVEASFREAIRVTRPGGITILSMPNYDSFYEGHYRMMWLPYVLHRKSAARWYVGQVRNRPVEFLDHLNFVTPRWLRSLACAHAAVESTELYFTSFSKLAYVPALHRALSLGLDEKLGRFVGLSRGRVGRGLRRGAALATNLLAVAGLSPEFTLVCHKRSLA
jgi:SAM-dependent methyltransferase